MPKQILRISFVLLTMLMGSGVVRAEVDVPVGVDIHAVGDFDAPLGAEGSWAVVGDYGRCWHPNGVGADWRPYCEGEWVWTDSGWYWQSSEPWAWACYHYGRWGFQAGSGWFWIPGVEWSPAWVVWRQGGGYIGWAPCGPGREEVAPGLFAFVDVGHFGEPVRRNVVLVNNVNIANRTQVISGSRTESRDIGAGGSRRITINEGPKPEDMEKASGKKFTPAPIAEAARRTPPPQVSPARPRTTEPPNEARPAEPKAVEPRPTRSVPKPETPAPRPETPAPRPPTEERPNTSIPNKPEVPARPANPDLPQRPERPELPERNAPPAKPEGPAVPKEPARPERPAAPAKPDEPHSTQQ